MDYSPLIHDAKLDRYAHVLIYLMITVFRIVEDDLEERGFALGEEDKLWFRQEVLQWLLDVFKGIQETGLEQPTELLQKIKAHYARGGANEQWPAFALEVTSSYSLEPNNAAAIEAIYQELQTRVGITGTRWQNTFSDILSSEHLTEYDSRLLKLIWLVGHYQLEDIYFNTFIKLASPNVSAVALNFNETAINSINAMYLGKSTWMIFELTIGELVKRAAELQSRRVFHSFSISQDGIDVKVTSSFVVGYNTLSALLEKGLVGPEVLVRILYV